MPILGGAMIVVGTSTLALVLLYGLNIRRTRKLSQDCAYGAGIYIGSGLAFFSEESWPASLRARRITSCPRFLMPEAMQKAGLFTINAWAIDGFTKVFWRDEPVSHLWPQVAVLIAAGCVLFAIARKLAKRWEYV